MVITQWRGFCKGVVCLLCFLPSEAKICNFNEVVKYEKIYFFSLDYCEHVPLLKLMLLRKNTDSTEAKILKDLAYENNKSLDYRVYLEEDNQPVPFIVLSCNNYKGCLLLREHLLDERVCYNDPQEYASYYKNSNVDSYLNNEYIKRLSPKIQSSILTSDVEITSKEAIDTHKDSHDTIKRKVFLLSANEINASVFSTVKEGTPLQYFSTVSSKIATYRNGEPDSWILRTPALRDGNTLIGVADDGSTGIGGISKSGSGIRPAFCVSDSTEVVLRSDIIKGKKIYSFW